MNPPRASYVAICCVEIDCKGKKNECKVCGKCYNKAGKEVPSSNSTVQLQEGK